jgi:hypothetical protein
MLCIVLFVAKVIIDIIATVIATSPPDVTFGRDFLGPRLVARNSLLVRLEDIHLSDAPDEFRWNLHANGKFSVDSLYLQSDTPVDKNKKIWKMRIPLKNKKKLHGIFVVGLFSPKIILLSGIGMKVLSVFSVIKIKTRLLNTCSSSAILLDLYSRSSK